MAQEKTTDINVTGLSSDHGPDKSGWSAALYNKTGSFAYSPAFTAAVVDLLAPQPGERIIDFGCGTGEVTLKIEKAVREGGVVVGVDFSESMISQARANGLKHAFVSDIQNLELPAEAQGAIGLDQKFDAVFSNAALHWCKRDPRGALESARRVLKPGGRFVGEMGGFLNCIGVRSAIHLALKKRGHDPLLLDPWWFPSVEEYENLLNSCSFEPIHVSLTPRLNPLKTGLYAWLELFVRTSFLRDFSDEEAREIMMEVEEHCKVDCLDGNGNWAMLYMRLRFCAVLK